MHDHPSPTDYLCLAAIAAGAATTCWLIRREGDRIQRAVEKRHGRDQYWHAYADVLDDLGDVGGGVPTS